MGSESTCATLRALSCACHHSSPPLTLCLAPPRWDAWAADLKKAEAAKEAANARTGKLAALGRSGQRLANPLALLDELEQLLPDNSILVVDGGDFVATASYILRPRGPLAWLDPGAFGTLGVGGGFALGAKLSRSPCCQAADPTCTLLSGLNLLTRVPPPAPCGGFVLVL